MRFVSFSILTTLAAMLALAVSGAAQPAAQENLDTVLAGWEKAMTDLQSFVSVVERTTLDKAVGAKDEHKGYAMFLKAAVKNDGSRARLEMAKVKNTKIFEKYICTGTYLYEYVPANSLVRIHDMPKTKQAGIQQESFLSFLFGMSAAEAKKRYDMVHVVPKTPDKFYHYILIRPKLQQDKTDFSEARLCLYRSNNLPAQIWYLHSNKSEITWTFSKLQLNVQIPLKYFEPDRPPGWREERMLPKAELKAAPKFRN